MHDITRDKLEETAGVLLAEIDYVLVSYVCIYVAKQRGDPVHEVSKDYQVRT